MSLYNLASGELKKENHKLEAEIEKLKEENNRLEDFNEELMEERNRLNNIINDKKERQDIAIRLLHKLFGTDDYEINYIIGIINGQRQIKFDDEILDKGE